MDRFLEYIERYKFAIIGTVLVHLFIFTSSNIVTLDSPYHSRFAEEESPTEITLETDEIELDPALLEMLNQQNLANNTELVNQIADQNDRREKSYENYSEQELEQQVLEEARALEQQYFDEWAATHGDGEGAPPKQTPTEPKNLDTQPKRNDQQKSDFNESAQNAFAGQVMVSFNLKDRKAHSLKIPGYTCNGSGTIVIDIKVDRSGNVKSATFNPNGSVNANECMIEKSLKYAKMARFNLDDGAPALASGLITYKFQGQ